jgi:hypothetical protein
MAHDRECKTCKKYWPLEKGLKNGTKQLSRGYCLARTIFPKGRVGERVYPPRARIEETENDMVKSVIVREGEIVAYCKDYMAGRKVA